MGSTTSVVPTAAPLGWRLARAAVFSVLAIVGSCAGVFVAMSTPTCDGAAAEDLLLQAFGGSQFAMMNSLRAVQVLGAVGASYSFGDAQRQCTGTLLLSNSARMDIRYTITGSRWDGVSVSMERAR